MDDNGLGIKYSGLMNKKDVISKLKLIIILNKYKTFQINVESYNHQSILTKYFFNVDSRNRINVSYKNYINSSQKIVRSSVTYFINDLMINHGVGLDGINLILDTKLIELT